MPTQSYLSDTWREMQASARTTSYARSNRSLVSRPTNTSGVRAFARRQRDWRPTKKKFWMLPSIAVSAMYQTSTALFELSLALVRGRTACKHASIEIESSELVAWTDPLQRVNLLVA